MPIGSALAAGEALVVNFHRISSSANLIYFLGSKIWFSNRAMILKTEYYLISTSCFNIRIRPQ